MKSLLPKAAVNVALVLTVGFMLTGCGFFSWPPEEVSRENALRIRQSLAGDWYMSRRCNWALGRGCTDYTEEESYWTLSFYGDSRVASYRWDEDGSHLEYDTIYDIVISSSQFGYRNSIEISGGFRYLVTIRSRDMISLGEEMADGIEYTFRSLGSEEQNGSPTRPFASPLSDRPD